MGGTSNRRRGRDGTVGLNGRRSASTSREESSNFPAMVEPMPHTDTNHTLFLLIVRLCASSVCVSIRVLNRDVKRTAARGVNPSRIEIRPFSVLTVPVCPAVFRPIIIIPLSIVVGILFSYRGEM